APATGRIPLIAPQQNAVAAAQPVGALSVQQVQGATTSTTTIGARGLLDADTSDDLIVDVPDDSDRGGAGGELSAAITSLPADVQMIGYRVMWALAGVVAFAAAGISYYMRDTEAEPEVETRPAAPIGAPPPVRRPAPPSRVPARL